MRNKESGTLKKAVFYSFGQISDQTAYQSFILLIFTFYFAVVGIDVWLITLGYAIWAVWNAINDPLIGYLSDRTHTRWGRRLPYIMIFFIPLGIITFLLFTPPLPAEPENQIGNFVYFFIIILVFELIYTSFSLNYTSLFPEVFMSEEERTKGNNVRQIFTIVALIFAFILPGMVIDDFSDPGSLPQYQVFGIIAAIIIIIAALVPVFLGPKERPEFSEDYKNAFSFFNTIKFCLRSKSFRWYIISETANWFVFGMLPTIVPLYSKYVLNVTDAFLASVLLGLTFISATIFITILWRPIVRKIGNRKSWMISMFVWILGLLPFMFIGDFISGLIAFFLLGIGLAGSLYIIDLVVADIVDEDEIETGMRREAGYYGVNAFILRFSNVLVILAIGSIFSTVGWTTFESIPLITDVVFGLRILMFLFPAIALAIAIFAIYKYPLDGEKLKAVKEKLQEIHATKKERT
jgi:GPH family glycoside/pentoside/hexuronide:cation symporter